MRPAGLGSFQKREIVSSTQNLVAQAHQIVEQAHKVAPEASFCIALRKSLLAKCCIGQIVPTLANISRQVDGRWLVRRP